MVITYGFSTSTWSHHRRTCLRLPALSKEECGRKAAQIRPKRAPKCCVCAHPDRATIDAELRAGRPLTQISDQYGFSDNTYSHHRRACLGLPRKPGRRKGDVPLPDTEVCANLSCGQPFHPRRSRHRFCSIRCGVLAQKRMARTAVARTAVPFTQHVQAQLEKITQNVQGKTAQIEGLMLEKTCLEAQAAHLREVLRLMGEMQL
jgi:hypothetical protein